MARVGMNGVLLAVSAVLLGLFGSGYALKCFNCPIMSEKACTTNVTCQAGKDACLLIKSGSARLTTCLAYNSCNNDFLAKEYNLGTFSYDCCQKELCNSSVMTVVNKTIMSLVAMLALVWICF
ncbi:CD59 glycoprotein [Pleurodeles waltl]|uniref:CD59 glycoprotein n=1 Tax=Pleurodeles waltl TaxID=8319 RepID=UPI0037096115